MNARRKLVGFTDTKAEALKKQKMLSKKGLKDFSIKKEYGGYSLLAKRSKKR